MKLLTLFWIIFFVAGYIVHDCFGWGMKDWQTWVVLAACMALQLYILHRSENHD